MRLIPLQERFDAKYTPVTESGCWIWVGTSCNGGYGRIMINKKWIRAHRASWQLHNGDIPEGMSVCHKCDIPGCVNPDHLFLGSHLENMRDMAVKGRRVDHVGESNGLSKLTDASVREIRRSRHTNPRLAEMYGVSLTTIKRVKARRIWKHV